MQETFWSFDDNVKSSVITENDNTTQFDLFPEVLMGRQLKSISICRPANLHTKICLKKKDEILKICYLF
jgi:hypothetical protein